MFEIFKNNSGAFCFRLKSKNGETILVSDGYTQKTNCQKGIGSVKRNTKNEDRFEFKQSSNKKWYFNLKAGNGQSVCVGEKYDNESSVKNAAKLAMKTAPIAEIIDLTK